MLIKPEKVDFSNVEEPGLITVGLANTTIKSVEISNTSNEIANIEIIRKDAFGNEYMLQPASVAPSNYVALLVNLNISLPLGDKLICRTANTNIKVIANVVNL